MNCPLCGTELSERVDKEYYACECCSALVKDRDFYLSAEEEKAIYERHNNDVDDPRYQKFTSPITDYVLEHFTENHKGLDFGSGTGPVISKMLNDENYDILQYDPFFANHSELLKKHYDYIICCEVFEHFHSPCSEIKNLRNMLKKNGELLIMTLLYNDDIDFSKWFYRRDPTHIFIYRKETFRYVARKMNFEIKKMDNRFVSMQKSDFATLSDY